MEDYPSARPLMTFTSLFASFGGAELLHIVAYPYIIDQFFTSFQLLLQVLSAIVDFQFGCFRLAVTGHARS